MQVLLLSNDLMTASQIEGAVRASGGEITVATTVASRGADESLPDVVILDLSTTSDVTATVEQFVECSPRPRIIAFGPHVHAAKLQAARDAGCREVYSRGQFLPQVADVLQNQGEN